MGMHNLYELMELEYQKQLGQAKGFLFEEIIKDEEECRSFLQQILQDDAFTKGEINFSIAKARARHSFVVFLMGLVFSDFGDLFQKINHATQKEITTKSKTLNYSGAGRVLWLLTALYHDRGYFSKRLSKGDIDYKREFKYYLLTDTYEDALLSLRNYSEQYNQAMAFTYDEITSYDQYARDYHREKGDKEERVDHGILGGCIVFDELIKRSLKHDNQYDFATIKTSCITIAQHNIFKSNSPERDKLYPTELLSKLGYNSAFRIDESTPLLLLLDLIDTIECCKRFGQAENGSSYLQLKTVLQAIRVEVGQEEIVLDFSELRHRVDEKKTPAIKETFKKYKEAICGLNTWTDIQTSDNNKEIIKLSIANVKTSEEVA